MAEVRRATERFHTDTGATTTWHSFSYGRHYDPERVGFGPIMAINEESLMPGAGYPSHRHSDVEIITWVIDGTLAHRDSTGFGGEIRPGVLQHLSAGDGVSHSEVNASSTESLRFLQMMLRSDHDGPPRYGQKTIPEGPGLHPGPRIAGPASVHLARWDAPACLDVPAGEGHLVHVIAGEVRIADILLQSGDEHSEMGKGPLVLTAEGPTEAVVWVVHPSRNG